MISVVITLYNKAHTISNTLTSVLNQTFKEFEVIIVNDGSTDNSIEIIERLTSDSRIRIINQLNQGEGPARNSGVNNSKFEYIAFLDGDDEWLPDYLLKMKESIDLFPNAGLFCSAGFVKNADGSYGNRVAKKYKNKILSINFFENPHVFLHTSAAVVKRETYNKTSGFPSGIWGADFSFYFSIALTTEVIYSGYQLAIYNGGVEGQLIGGERFDKKGNYKNDTCTRNNNVYTSWINSDKQNILYPIFMKYELRHKFKTFIANREYKLINYYYENLNPELLNEFSIFERYIYKKHSLRVFSLSFIALTKVRWRLRGFPRVGEVQNKNTI